MVVVEVDNRRRWWWRGLFYVCGSVYCVTALVDTLKVYIVLKLLIRASS